MSGVTARLLHTHPIGTPTHPFEIHAPAPIAAMLASKQVQAVRPAQASRRVAVKPVAALKPAQKAQLAAAAAVVGLAAAHPVRGRRPLCPD